VGGGKRNTSCGGKRKLKYLWVVEKEIPVGGWWKKKYLWVVEKENYTCDGKRNTRDGKRNAGESDRKKRQWQLEWP